MNTPHCTRSTSLLSGIQVSAQLALSKSEKLLSKFMTIPYEKFFGSTSFILPHDAKFGPGVPGYCWLLLAYFGSHGGRSLSSAANVSFLVHIAHTEPLLPREGKQKY